MIPKNLETLLFSRILSLAFISCFRETFEEELGFLFLRKALFAFGPFVIKLGPAKSRPFDCQAHSCRILQGNPHVFDESA